MIVPASLVWEHKRWIKSMTNGSKFLKLCISFLFVVQLTVHLLAILLIFDQFKFSFLLDPIFLIRLCFCASPALCCSNLRGCIDPRARPGRS